MSLMLLFSSLLGCQFTTPKSNDLMSNSMLKYMGGSLGETGLLGSWHVTECKCGAGSIRAVGRSFASSFGPSRQSFSRPRASMLAREAAHQSVPSALKSGSRDQIDQVSSNSRRHSVHFDHSLDSPPAAP